MKISLLNKLTALLDRYQTLAQLLADKAVIEDQNRFRELAKEYAQLEDIVRCFQAYQATLTTICDSEQMLQEEDLELRELALAELKIAKLKQHQLSKQLEVLLLPNDLNDQCNIFLEIRAAAGGDEAAIFAGDLLRMYARYVESKGWCMEVINAHLGEHGGYKEVITRIVGQDVYAYLKFESGAHRVQRVPSTEAQGRIHTSTCTVAVLPEIEMINTVIVNPADLKIDSFRASGAGGQHVQKTDSAIRITHLPTGLVVECQDERSQHKNRARALSLLQARLLAAQRAKQRLEQDEARRDLVGSGDRSERIRTYNFPQGRLTDHRISLTLYQLPVIMDGNLELVIEPLMQEHQAGQLAALSE